MVGWVFGETSGGIIVVGGVEVAFFEVVDKFQVAVVRSPGWGRDIDNFPWACRRRYEFFAGRVTSVDEADIFQFCHFVHRCDRVVVVRLGKIIEKGTVGLNTYDLGAM